MRKLGTLRKNTLWKLKSESCCSLLSENISNPVAHNCSVTVQRHQQSGNLKLWLTEWLTDSPGYVLKMPTHHLDYHVQGLRGNEKVSSDPDFQGLLDFALDDNTAFMNVGINIGYVSSADSIHSYDAGLELNIHHHFVFCSHTKFWWPKYILILIPHPLLSRFFAKLVFWGLC